MTRRGARASLLTLGLLAGCAGGKQPLASRSEPSPAAEREAVERELAAYAPAIRDSDDVYLGRRPLAQAEAELLSVKYPEEEFLLRDQVGWQSLRFGDNTRAIEEFQKCLEIAKRAGFGAESFAQALGRLGLAQLRLGEAANCHRSASSESCLFPIREAGVHRDGSAAMQAAAYYEAYLRLAPRALGARWLLNLAHMQQGSYPEKVPARYRIPESVLASAEAAPVFQDRAIGLGLGRLDLAGGAALEDFNEDGLLDVLVSTSDPERGAALFLADGKGGFEEASEAAGLDIQPGALNLFPADYDGDGRRDILLTRGAWHGELGFWRNSLLHNEGSGRFRDVTHEAGLALPAYPTQAAAWGDYDNDGDLDLYIGNEGTVYAFRPEYYPSQLFRNEGEGKFRDVAVEAGVTNDRFAKAVAWGDYDNDGDLDLYVSNFGPNRLYRNDAGKFTDVAVELGVVDPRGHSFACWFFDYDNDGDLDLFVAGYEGNLDRVVAVLLGGPVAPGERPWLYRNEAGKSFQEVGIESGLDHVYLPMGANFGDIDNDGWLDIYLGTGNPHFETLIPNAMLRNQAGKRFVDVTTSTRLGHLQKGHGIAFGDVDNDGDQDILLQSGGFVPADTALNSLFLNPGSPDRHWLTLRLQGSGANRDAVGARIRVDVREGEGRRSIHVVAGTGASFGASSHQQEIGLGPASAIEVVEIVWPGTNRREQFRGLELDRFYALREGAGKPEPLAPRALAL